MNQKESFTPTPFGKFYLLQLIAVGGMAEVYLALPQQTLAKNPTPSIIKKILPRYSANRIFVSMLIDEAKITSLIDHKNVVRILDLGSAENSFYLHLEWVQGKSLGQLIGKLKQKKERLPLNIYRAIIEQSCQGLAAAHLASDASGRPLSLIHRDITPGNILLSYQGQLKLSDFGITTAERKEIELPKEVAFGKLLYMSPEQLARKALSQKTDIYSLCSVFYELLTAQPLFSADSEIELQQLIKQGINENHFKQFEQLDLPPSWLTALQQGLSSEPNRRPQDPLALAKQFEEITAASEKELAKYINQLFGQEIIDEEKELNDHLQQYAKYQQQQRISLTDDSEQAAEIVSGKTEVEEIDPYQQQTAFQPLAKVELLKKTGEKIQKKEAKASLATDDNEQVNLLEREKAGVSINQREKTAGGEDLSQFISKENDQTELHYRQQEKQELDNDQTVLFERQEQHQQEQSYVQDIGETRENEAADFSNQQSFSQEKQSEASITGEISHVEQEITEEEPLQLKTPAPLGKVPAATVEEVDIEQQLEQDRQFAEKSLSIPRLRISLRQTYKPLIFTGLALLTVIVIIYIFIKALPKTENPLRFLPKKTAQIELLLFRQNIDLTKQEKSFFSQFFKRRYRYHNTVFDLENFFKNEYRRLTGKEATPLKLLLTPLQTISKRPPAKDAIFFGETVLSFFQRISSKEKYSYTSGQLSDAKIYIFFYRQDPLKASAFPFGHLGKRGQREGIVFIPTITDDLNYSLMYLAQEIARLYGAKDKLDDESLPLYPEGYADPYREPLYPQQKAELMAGLIPVSATATKSIKTLYDVVIGQQTAIELGWLKKD